MTGLSNKLRAIGCIVLAFVPILITAWDIHRDVVYSQRQILFNLVNLTAVLWLGLTIFHYTQSKTKHAAWLFALFPVAFAEPVLLFCLWFSNRLPAK